MAKKDYSNLTKDQLLEVIEKLEGKKKYGLVWDEEKMELLFDTLLKGDSFGGIMVIEEEKDSEPLFSFRPFTSDGGSIKSSEVTALDKSQYFVIDGQQRLQTFYIGLKGTINGKVLYFDLFSDYNLEYEFKFVESFEKF